MRPDLIARADLDARIVKKAKEDKNEAHQQQT